MAAECLNGAETAGTTGGCLCMQGSVAVHSKCKLAPAKYPKQYMLNAQNQENRGVAMGKGSTGRRIGEARMRANSNG